MMQRKNRYTSRHEDNVTKTRHIGPINTFRASALGGLFVVGLVVIAADALAAPQTIYVDTSGIGSWTGAPPLTPAQRNDLNQSILDHVKDNFAAAVEAANVTVTNDTAQQATASRNVTIHVGLSTPAGDRWGDWPPGSRDSNVYLGEFMDDGAVSGEFKTGGAWDVTKLANAIGRTAAHEAAHSFGVGHNKHNPPDKMTECVTAKQRATLVWEFDAYAKNLIEKEWDDPPPTSAPDYDPKSTCSSPLGGFAVDDVPRVQTYHLGALLTGVVVLAVAIAAKRR